jgi:putative membrane protein
VIGHGFWGGPVGWGVVAGLVLLAFLVLVVLVVVVVASLIRSRPGVGPGMGSRAIRILQERYAGGEISRDEFLERRTVLNGSSKRPPSGIGQLSEPPVGAGPSPGFPGA